MEINWLAVVAWVMAIAALWLTVSMYRKDK